MRSGRRKTPLSKRDEIPLEMVDRFAQTPLAEDLNTIVEGPANKLRPDTQTEKFYRRWGPHFIKNESNDKRKESL